MLAAELDDAVRTLRSTAALHVALIDRRARRHANHLVRVVSELCIGIVCAALRLLPDTTGALAPDHSILIHRQVHTFAGQVVVYVTEINHLQWNRPQLAQWLL